MIPQNIAIQKIIVGEAITSPNKILLLGRNCVRSLYYETFSFMVDIANEYITNFPAVALVWKIECTIYCHYAV